MQNDPAELPYDSQAREASPDPAPLRQDIVRRLGPNLARAWTPVPAALIEGMFWIEWSDPERGPQRLRPIHFVILVHLLAAKWDERHPYVSMKVIAERTGVSYKSVVENMEDLVMAGLVRKVARPGGSSRRLRYEYDLSGLFDKLGVLHTRVVEPRLKRAAQKVKS